MLTLTNTDKDFLLFFVILFGARLCFEVARFVFSVLVVFLLVAYSLRILGNTDEEDNE